MIILDSKVSHNKIITNFLRRTEKDLERFFGVKIDPSLVVLLNSRQDVDVLFGERTPDWLVGFVRKNIIFILNPNIYTKESSHKDPQDFWKVLRHECCHLYYNKLAGDNYPGWLNEGLACFLAKQKKVIPELRQALLILEDNNRGKYNIYSVGYFWVSLLVRKFGPAKLKQLLAQLVGNNKRKNFKELFYKIYQVEFNRTGLKSLAEDFLK